tara:strand:- start:2561 stop:3130 length:570 start_codon:yes stop_codon:yes gene_type:complete
MIEIKTDRLILKKPKNKDEDLLISQIGNWDVAKWLSNVPYPYTNSHATEWFERTKSKDLELGIYLDDLFIGGIELSEEKNECYKLGYWLGRDYWGYGYATEAGKGLIQYISSQINSLTVTARCMNGNGASKNVLRKLGFKKVGEEKLYSVSQRKEVDCTLLILLKGSREDNVIDAAKKFSKKEEIWIPN